MDLGIFDHLDRREAPLDEFYESRLRLLEKYDAAGFYSYHLAEHHATPLGLAPVPGIFLAAATQTSATSAVLRERSLSGSPEPPAAGRPRSRCSGLPRRA